MSGVVVDCLFHKGTNTCTFVVGDSFTKRCAIIDSVWDFDVASGTLSFDHDQKVIELVTAKGYTVEWILETHIHADHLTGAQHMKAVLGGKIGMGRRVIEVQATFKALYNLSDFEADGRQFDHLFSDGETFQIGRLEARVMETPGHTPACVTYVIGNAAFTGDTAFMPDNGTARCDFPGGSPEQLYASVKRIEALPEGTRCFVGHDYPPAGRDVRFEISVAEQRRDNKHIKDGTSLSEYVQVRTARDKTLDAPKLLLPALQVNIRAGHLPASDSNGVVYLRIPLTLKK